MNLSQKCQYAVRALFELARHEEEGPIRIAEIAEAQAIPIRFLQGILNSLRGSGIVESARGRQGGYRLAKSARELSVGEVIRFFEGPLIPVTCLTGDGRSFCSLRGQCVFESLWKKAQEALEGVYDTTTFRDLVEADRKMEHERRTMVCDYVI